MRYDVAIIGGGVTGAMVLRQLMRYQLKAVLLEKEDDVVMGATKANSAIVHAGFDAEPGTNKARYNVEGNRLMEEVTTELSVPFCRNGSLVLAFSEEDLQTVQNLLERGKENGVPGLQLLTPEEVWAMEPQITREIKGALYAPTGGIVCPYELAIGGIENAMDNGAELRTNFKVEKIQEEDGFFTIHSSSECVEARYIVNAAGVHADEVARMIGDESFTITPRRGEYELLDKTQGKMVKCTIFQPPTKMGKGILVTPTVDGNLLTGPTSENILEKENTATTPEGLETVQKLARKSVPNINYRMVITSFTGLRACSDTHDFVIGPSEKSSHLIHAAGIESPGLTSAPAIGKAVVKHLAEAGLELIPNPNFNPIRKPFPKFREMSDEERAELVRKDPHFGRIVCRCEGVTEGEILAAIHRNPPARSVDAVKRRARAGMGRCQGGFCGPQVVEILAKELGVPMEEITKSGGESRMLTGKTRS
ncbi:MAG: NAD(P)/FAD-dependent oxidoreductase [Candidatus Merdivicinus sp.]|jgi:glycerol-3-phosphate dehydrogenase